MVCPLFPALKKNTIFFLFPADGTHSKPATLSCGQCGGFFYCTRAHQVAHWTSLGHHSECARISRQISRADELRREDGVRWLTWAWCATVDVDEGRETRCTLLGKLGVHGVGPYRRECACYAKTPFGTLPAEDHDDRSLDVLFTSRGRHAQPRGGGGGVSASSENPNPEDDVDAVADVEDDMEDDEDVSTWPQLYRRLGLPSTSPAALVLSTAGPVEGGGWRGVVALCTLQHHMVTLFHYFGRLRLDKPYERIRRGRSSGSGR